MYEIEDKIYCYPKTDTLINKFHIKDKTKLESLERDLTALRIKELLQNPIQGDFDLQHLQNIHKHIFQDLFYWAGELRTIRMSKGIMFAYPENIKTEGNRYFSMLKAENYLLNLPLDLFCEKLAFYKAEINMLHPFRDGNGRALREFFRCLIAYNGYQIVFPLDKTQYLQAMILSPNDIDPLKNFFIKNINKINDYS